MENSTNNTAAPKLRQLTAKQQHDLLRRTFTEDPYAFTEAWDDAGTFRAELENIHRNMAPEDAAADRRRLAMAAYYCGFQPGMFDYAYDNFEQFSAKANGGKQLDAWDDFDRVSAIFGVQQNIQKEQPGFWGAAGAALQQDMLQLSGTVYNFLAAIAKGTATAASVQARAEAARVAPGAEKLLRTPDEAGKMAGEAVRKVYTNRLEGAKDTEQYLAQQTGVPENWVMNSGSVSNWFRNFGVSFIGSLPSTVANLGMSALGGPAAIGTVYAADGYYRALDEGMSEQEALGYGSLIGIINGVGETVTNKLLLGKGAADISKDALIKDLARNWFIRFARAGAISGQKEGWQEAAEQAAENIADIAFMRRGDYEKMDAKTLFKEVFRNVPEAYVQAVAVGFGLEAGNFKSKQSFNEMKLQEYRNIDAIQTTIAELENRSEELTQDERDLLQTLTVLNDAGNPAMIAKGAEMAAVYKLRNELDKKRLQTAPDTEAAPEAAENGTADFSPEETAAFDNAGQTLKLRHFLPHDPQDTVNAVYDTMTKLGYTSEVEVMTTGWNDEQLNIIKAQLSPEVSAMLQNAPADAAQSILSKFYPAFYHNGTVYINALSVRPSEVSRVLAHEAGLHYGMRQAFKGDIDKMLDWVYSENFDTPELARIIEKYSLAEAELDEDGSPIYDGDGNAVFKELSEENRRIAAEELLADLAETGGYDYRKIYADNRSDIDAFAKDNNYDVTKLSSDDRKKLVKSWIDETGFTPAKANWFKRLVSNVRIWFHNHGIKIKHLSDDDIANIILRSAKAARERRKATAKENLAVGDGVRFSIIGEAGARALDLYLKQNNMDNLDIAREMLNSGKDAKTIKLATGWEKGGDGKWRMEIPDIEMKKTQSFLGKEEKIHPPVKLSNYLDQIIDAPELFAAYPEAKNIIVRVTDELPKNVGGRYVPAQKRILIKDSLTELQLDQIRRQNRKIQRAENWTESDTKTAQMLGLETDPVKVKEDAQKVLDLIVNAQLYEYRLTLIHEIQHFIQDQEGFAKGGNSQGSGFEKYKHLGGEVEARNATRRSRMSMDERRSSLLTETEDVAEESKIYLFDNDDTSNFAVDGKYFKKWQDVIEQFKKDLEGIELNQEQQDIYDVVLQQKDKIRLRINDLNELEDIFVNFGSRQKGIRKLISVHYAGLRNPVTALEVLNIGDVIRRGKLTEEGNAEYPNSRRYELIASDGAVLKVIIDFNRKKDKNRSVINFYSDRTDPRGQASSGGVTDLSNNISQNPENASSTDKNGPSAAPDGAMEGKRTETDKSDGNGALFTLNSNASEELKQQVMAMRPLVGNWLDQDGAEYARRFKERYGISIDPEEAKLIAALAIRENKSARQKQIAADNSARAVAHFKSFNPLFDFIANFAGDNFKINPGKDFAGDEFTGTFIVKEYRDYSVKRRQDPNESDAKYRQYLAKRDKALAKVSGTPLDEVAQAYAREYGTDFKETAEQMVDLLRHLNRQDIISQFKSYKDEQIAADKAELEALRRATEDQQRRRIEEEVTTVIQSKSAIDADFVKQNPKVYTALQEALFPGQAPVPHVSKTRLQEINAAIASTKGDASGFIEGFRAGRDAAFKDYSKKLKDFREKMRSADADRIAIARKADTLLRQLLPKEEYSKFARRVIALRDITDPKARLAAFDALRKDIVAFSEIVKRDQTLEYFTRRLQQLGRRSDTGRKAIGVRDEATQRQIDQIREYAALSRDEAASLIENLQNKLEAADADTFQDEVSLKLLLTFGALDSKTLPELLDAAEQLEELARIGRENFNAALAERAANDEALRQQVIAAIKTGKAPSNKLERLSNKNKQAAQSKLQQSLKLGIWDNLNLWGMFDLMNKTDSDVFAKLARDTHSAARNEDTINFRNADDLNRELNSLLGTNSAFDRAEKILEWRKVVKNSGVFRYSHSDNATKRFKYTYYRISDAKYLLEEYDRNPAGSVLQDYQAEAVRHQLANFDNKVRKDPFSSFSDGVTEKLEKLAANEEIKRSYDGMDDGESLVCVPTPDFSQAVYGQMELSQMQALSLWLYARQPTMAYKLHFNGFDNKTLEQLDAFLSPELKKLGLWMVKQLELDRTKIGEVYEKLYFTSFPTEQNYFPAVFEHTKGVGGKEGVDLTQQGAGNAPMSYSPGALKQRVFHLGEPQIADALTIFQNHRLMMNHFVTHGESVRQLRAIFNNKELQTAIIDQYGAKAYRALADQLEAFVKGGNVNAQANAIYQAFYGAWVRSKMAANITSGIKQTLGFITYAQEIPASALAKGSAYALRHPGEALEILKQSDYFNNRLRGGANAELRWLLDASGQAAGKKQALSRLIDEGLSAALRFGDAASVLLGGYATYKYHLDNLVDRGVDKAEAHKLALLEMEMATERTQQSSKPHMLTAAQRSPLRAFTSFKSNQILLMNKLIPAIINRDGKQIRASLGALIVSSVVMTAVGDLLRKGLDFDEYEWTDYIENIGADFLSGNGFAGALGSEALSAAMSEFKKGSFRFRGSDPLSDSYNMVAGLFDIAEHMEDGDAYRIFGDVQKILTGAGLLTDTFSNNFFVSSAAAIVRESRKWWNILSGNNKGGRRRSKRRF